MFNAERLLGKIVKETLGGSSSRSRKGSGLLDSLTSGQGLMTVIGLGVGAYEILKDQKGQKGSGSVSGSVPPAIPSASRGTGAPPPLPGRTSPLPVSSPSSAKKEEQLGEDPPCQEIALRMIRVMIAAAHADGTLDASEEKSILDRLRRAKLDSEEKMFLIRELHEPKSLAELTLGINDPSVSKTMYMLAVATIDVDTDAERSWMDELGDQLGLTPELRRFIEEES